MDFLKAVSETRTCRRFNGARRLPGGTLSWLVDCARLTPSAGNLQILRYITIGSPNKCAEVFPTLRWAAYLKDWNGPEPKERPTGYVVIMAKGDEDKKIGKMTLIDVGVAAQTMHLAAGTAGLASCMFGSFDAVSITSLLQIPTEYTVALVMAFGFPVEARTLVPLPKDGSVRYYRNAEGVHFVPKRSLPEVLLKEY